MINKLVPVLPVVLSVAGLAFLTAAAWVWLGLAAGLAAVGVSLLLLEWRISE